MNFSEYVQSIVPMSKESERELISYFHRIELHKGDQLFRQGEVCNKIFFIEKGLARVYYYTESGKEITAWFSHEGSFITAIDSYLQNIATNDNCEVLEDSTVFVISKNSLENLIANNHAFALIAIDFLKNVTNELTELMLSVKVQSAKGKYCDFMKRYPLNFKRIPSSQIASYIGITPETLSRIRAER